MGLSGLNPQQDVKIKVMWAVFRAVGGYCFAYSLASGTSWFRNKNEAKQVLGMAW